MIPELVSLETAMLGGIQLCSRTKSPGAAVKNLEPHSDDPSALQGFTDV